MGGGKSKRKGRLRDGALIFFRVFIGIVRFRLTIRWKATQKASGCESKRGSQTFEFTYPWNQNSKGKWGLVMDTWASPRWDQLRLEEEGGLGRSGANWRPSQTNTPAAFAHPSRRCPLRAMAGSAPTTGDQKAVGGGEVGLTPMAARLRLLPPLGASLPCRVVVRAMVWPTGAAGGLLAGGGGG